MQDQRTTPSGASGATLAELLVTLALVGIAMTIAVVSLDRVSPPIDRATRMTKGFLSQARSKAMSTTRAYRVSPSGDSTLIAEFAGNCSASTWTADTDVALELPDPVVVTSTSWQACFSSRGLSSAATSFTLSEDLGAGVTRTQNFQLLLGGSVRVTP